MALIGTLNDFSLVDIIQLVDLGKKTGILLIHGRRGSAALGGRFYFQEGKIHSAEFDDLAGDEAAYTLFMATEGSFEFVQTSELPPRNIHASNETLIMEGAARQDAWSAIEARVPPEHAVPALVPDPPAAPPEIRLELQKWRVVTLIDGKRTVAEILRRSRFGHFRTCQLIVELIDAGLAVVTGEAQAVAPGKSLTRRSSEAHAPSLREV